MKLKNIKCKKRRKRISGQIKKKKKLCYMYETCALYNSFGCPYCGSGDNYGICDEYKAVK